ncbi:MAG: hypothetical protein JNL22_03145 [Bacteroidales bacterium]|jgi:hypothetical protein|nr:hypothetical protein [Bacteroidales bacterium]
MEEHNYTTPEIKDPITLNQQSVESLTETRKWTTFFSILGFIFVGLMVVLALVMALILPFLNETSQMPYPPFLLSVVYLIFGGLYLLPVIFLMRFGSLLKRALLSGSTEVFGEAMKNLALHFRTVGIMTIIFIALYILAIIAMVILGAGLFAGGFLNA